MKTPAVFIASLFWLMTSAQDQKIDSSEISIGKSRLDKA